jgi:hypothetical protein
MGDYNSNNDEIDDYGFPIIPPEWDADTNTNIPQDISAYDTTNTNTNTNTNDMSETTIEVLKR